MSIKESFGLFCNYSGDRYVKSGALAVLTIPNGGAERYLFVVMSRGGRMIERYMRLDRCSNWRVKFVPGRFRKKTATSLFKTRDDAQRELDRLRPAR